VKLSQNYLKKQKQQLLPANRPSLVWNEMEDMEESFVPEALFLRRAQDGISYDYSMFCTKSLNTDKAS